MEVLRMKKMKISNVKNDLVALALDVFANFFSEYKNFELIKFLKYYMTTFFPI